MHATVLGLSCQLCLPTLVSLSGKWESQARQRRRVAPLVTYFCQCSQYVSLAGDIRFMWYCQRESGEGMNLPGLSSIARLKVKELWVWVAFLFWVGGFYYSYNYIVPTILGSQTTLHSSKHISHFSFGCLLHHFQGLYLYLAGRSEKNRSTPSYPLWK